MQKLLLVGSSSMVGSRVAELLAPHFSLEFADKNITLSEAKVHAMDITNEQNVHEVIENSQAETVLQFAAFTDVDRAEEERGNEDGLAWKINVLGTQYLVDACKKRRKKLVYISTDFVFKGDGGPYAEEASPMKNPDEGSWYGWSKRKAEMLVEETLGEKSLIVRLAYPFRARYDLRPDFVRKIIKRLEDNSLYPMFKDQFISPVFVDDVTTALRYLLEDDQNGTWHVVGSTILTPFTAAQSIATVFDCDVDTVKGGSLEEYLKTHGNPNARLRYPKNAALINDKINALLAQHNERLHTFSESLQLMKEQVSTLNSSGDL